MTPTTTARPGNWQSIKTHCPHGHAYTPENTLYSRFTGGRYCRECGRERKRRQAGPITVTQRQDDGPVDDVAIWRALDGQPVTLTQTERDIVVTTLTSRGWSALRIARLLGCAPRTINRVRAATA